jgi:hypothetical protein
MSCTRWLSWSFLAFALAGCQWTGLGADAAEATHPWQDDFRGLEFRGSRVVSLSALLATLENPGKDPGWRAGWKTAPGPGAPGLWGLQGVVDGSVVFSVAIAPDSSRIDWMVPASAWLDRCDQLTFQAWSMRQDENGYTWSMTDETAAGLRVVDDRSPLEWIRIPDTVQALRAGDTVAVVFRNPGSSPLSVYDDHQGFRTVGPYLVEVPPGGVDSLRWVVTATAPEAAWIDLGWGRQGAHRRFPFVLR